LLHLLRPLPLQSATLLEGFWPSNNWKSNYFKASLLTTIVGFDLNDPILCFHCEPKNMKLSIVYTMFKDINDGDFVLIRLHDLDLFPIWSKEHKVML
jgi:hypothetical protein